MTMNFDSMILDLANDDYTGLWELVWRARTTTADTQTGALVARLRSELEALIHEGKLALFRGIQFTGEEKLVSVTDVPALLLAPHSWEPPATGETHLRVLTTQPRP